MRRFGLIAAVAMTVMVPAGIASATAPTSAASTTNVRPVDLSRFVALAQHGLRVPFEASYRFVYPKGAGKGKVHAFRVWSESSVGSEPWGDFVYETPFGSGMFRFIQSGSRDHECLQAASQSKWRCVGPFGVVSIGQTMQVEGYRYPMWTAGNINPGHPPRSLSYRTVLGRRLWCLGFDTSVVFCITKTGQLGFETTGVAKAGQFEMLSLTLAVSRSAFVLPAKPTRVRTESFPNICGKQACPSPGIGM